MSSNLDLNEERIVDLPRRDLRVACNDQLHDIAELVVTTHQCADGGDLSPLVRCEVSVPLEVEAIAITKASEFAAHDAVEQSTQGTARHVVLADSTDPRVHIINVAVCCFQACHNFPVRRNLFE